MSVYRIIGPLVSSCINSFLPIFHNRNVKIIYRFSSLQILQKSAFFLKFEKNENMCVVVARGYV